MKADTEEQRPRNTQVHIEVAIVGAVGALDSVGVSSSDGAADNHGKLILRSLEENEVDVSGVKIIQDEKTGFAHINVDYNDPNNTKVITIAKANDHLKAEMFPELPKPRPDLLLLQLEISSNTVHHLIRLAKKEKVPVILNAAPKNEVPDDIYPLVDHFILNEIQADFMTGVAPVQGRREHISEIHERYLEACEHFHILGARNVVITLNNLGAVGSSIEEGSGRRKRYLFDAAVGPDGIKDTTGGSDTFIGAYAVEVVRQTKLEGTFEMGRILDFAIKAAGITIGTMGSMKGIPWRNQVLCTKFKSAEVI